MRNKGVTPIIMMTFAALIVATLSFLLATVDIYLKYSGAGMSILSIVSDIEPEEQTCKPISCSGINYYGIYNSVSQRCIYSTIDTFSCIVNRAVTFKWLMEWI